MIEVNIFLDEDDIYMGSPAPEYIMRYLMHHKIGGATAFVVKMGYGSKHHLNIPKQIGGVDENPIMIMFIDEEQNVDKVLPHLKEVVKDGLIIKKKVEKV